MGKRLRIINLAKLFPSGLEPGRETGPPKQLLFKDPCMNGKMKPDFYKEIIRPTYAVGLLSLAIHGVFCVSVFMALPYGAMANNDVLSIIFLPHYILMFFCRQNIPFKMTIPLIILTFLGKFWWPFPRLWFSER